MWGKALLSIAVAVLAAGPAFAQTGGKPSVAISEIGVAKEISATGLSKSVMVSEFELAVRNTGKFSVLTREDGVMGQVLKEQKFSQSELSSGNAAHMGQMSAAAYLVVPVVQVFDLKRTHTPIPNIDNKYFRQDTGSLRVSAQIVNTTTGEIKSAFVSESAMQDKKVMVNGRGGSPSRDLMVALVKTVAADMANLLIDAVFPMQVIKATPNEVYINRGNDGGLSAGAMLNVYRPGEQLKDPYTGESLGSAEELVGQVKVARINPKFTIALPTKETTDIQVGYILRAPKKK